MASLPLRRDSTSPQCAHCGLRDSVDLWPLRLRDWGTDVMDLLQTRAMRIWEYNILILLFSTWFHLLGVHLL